MKVEIILLITNNGEILVITNTSCKLVRKDLFTIIIEG